MFAERLGHVMNDRARALLLKVAPVLMKLHEKLSITGHTDAAALQGRRPVQLGTLGRPGQRDAAPVGRGGPAREAGCRACPAAPTATRCCPLTPPAAANRRIAIVVLRDAVAARPRG